MWVLSTIAMVICVLAVCYLTIQAMLIANNIKKENKELREMQLLANNREATYDSKNKKLYIDAYAHECYPPYMKYVLEYLKLPADTEIIYTKTKEESK